MSVILDFSLNLCRKSTVILQSGIQYSMHDLIWRYYCSKIAMDHKVLLMSEFPCCVGLPQQALKSTPKSRFR